MENNWKNNTILFILSQTLSLFGSALVQYAIMWHITLETQSGVMMTVYIICGFLPTFFLSPFAGVWADRYDRKKIIILADSLIAITTLILAITFYSGYNSMWMLFAAATIRSLGGGIQSPAVNAIIPQIVPMEKLTKVNATNSSIQSMVSLLSPMLSGALLSVTTIEVIFMIDVVTAFIAVVILLLFLRVPLHAKALEKQDISYFADMKEGLIYINKHSFLKTMFFFLAIFYILAAPSAFLTPLQVTRSFGDDVWRLTAIEITFSIGMMFGGLIMATWGGFRNKIHSMSISVFVMGISAIALGLVPNFWLFIIFMGTFGIAMPIFNTPAMVLFQEKVEGDFLGRVFSVLGMITSVMMPLGMLVFGPMADYIRIEWLMIGTGTLIVILTFFMRVNKILIEAGKPVEKNE
ncbi:MFS transporter [Sedimentibacter sp. MB31-C6]|uniref:MFS transporter n=1 Tax=Sedimentibacter sp. MB31-C6 TaxID=3109366 RepID=UPI002DDD4F4E|nr:MFS transporter [Sedimentibacter sp. MB36-C1]WSI03645.1 MFS transporter [Sedimentibacter sp. MB36-C1]